MGPGAIVAPAPKALNPIEPCATAAVSGPSGIAISDNLMLTALFSAYLIDAHYLAAPKRALQQADQVMPRVDHLDAAAANELLSRLRALPLYKHHVRTLRAMGIGAAANRDVTPKGLAAEATIPFNRVEEAFYGRFCALTDHTCAVTARLAHVLLSWARLQLLLDEQVDFMIAHEMGH
jgi:hypothetical protein